MLVLKFSPYLFYSVDFGKKDGSKAKKDGFYSNHVEIKVTPEYNSYYQF